MLLSEDDWLRWSKISDSTLNSKLAGWQEALQKEAKQSKSLTRSLKKKAAKAAKASAAKKAQPTAPFWRAPCDPPRPAARCAWRAR